MRDPNEKVGPLYRFNICYLKNICPYLNLPICFMGSILNILNIMVFSRKTIASPMSTIFLHLSIVELAVLLVNIPLQWHVCQEVNQHTYNWEIFHYLGRCATSVLYYISVWLTVMLTVWRYLAIVHPFDERRWCNMEVTRNGVIAGYVFAVVLSIPGFFSLYVKPQTDNYYTLEYYEGTILFRLHSSLYGIVLKLLPSIILSILSYKLIKTLIAIKDEHVILSRNSVDADRRISTVKQQTDFTTKMLLGVLAAFLISEVPSGILGLCSLINGAQFRKDYYTPTVHVFTTIRLFSISVSFFVYYNLSQQFRINFKTMINHVVYKVTNKEQSTDITPDS